jgi:putative PIN family toxin of toxin-antitoxin system
VQKVVFDTNIYISALHFQGSIPRKILELVDAGNFQLFISKQIIAELRGVLRVKFKYELSKLDLMEELILSISQVVEPRIKIKFIKEDPDDDRILECAVEGKADFIVTGDRHLLQIEEFRGIKITSARVFMEEYLT